jgi:hypothetical protein
MTDRTFTPGPTPNTVRAADGKVLTVPEGWVLLPPGDAALTRRVKEAGDHRAVHEKKGRKTFSRGVWAPEATVPKTCPLMKALGNGGDRTKLPFLSLNDADFGARGHNAC